MARTPHPRAALMLVFAALGCGCGAAGSIDDGTTGATEDEPFDPPRISFDEASIELRADRRTDIMLRATSIEPGRTFLVIDGKAEIPADGITPVGSLQEGLLVLTLRGVLAPGEHVLELVTNGETGSLRSAAVFIEIDGVTAAELPTVTVGPSRGAVDGADHIFAHHVADRTELGLLSLGSPDASAELGIAARGETRWLAGSPFRVALAGLDVSDTDASDTLRATDLVAFSPRTAGADGLSYYVAWRDGPAGTVVREQAAAFLEASPLTEVFDVATVRQAPIAGARVTALRYLGDRLLVGFDAPVDVDLSRPGDRGVAWLHRDPVSDRATLGGEVTVSPRANLDALAPAISTAAPDWTRPRVGVRSHDARARLLEQRDGQPAVALRTDAGLADAADFDGAWAGRLVFMGALSSQTVIGVRSEGDVRLVSAISSTGAHQTRDFSQLLPDADVTGPPSGAAMQGLAVVVVPFGDAAPVHAIVGAGVELAAVALEGLRCDEVVVDASVRAFEEGVTDLACLSNGTVELHEMRLED